MEVKRYGTAEYLMQCRQSITAFRLIFFSVNLYAEIWT